MSESTRVESELQRPSFVLDIVFGLVLFALLFATFKAGFQLGPLQKGAAGVFLGAYIQAWGMLFWLGYFMPNASYLLKGMMWLCEHTGNPRGRWTALLFGTLAVTLGTIALLQ